jgi:hypothetical protein
MILQLFVLNTSIAIFRPDQILLILRFLICRLCSPVHLIGSFVTRTALEQMLARRCGPKDTSVNQPFFLSTAFEKITAASQTADDSKYVFASPHFFANSIISDDCVPPEDQ